MKIYLAGKISANCWRHKYVRGLREASAGEDGLLKNSIMGCMDYVGPFFISCDHGCYHGDNSHGVGIGQIDHPHYGGNCAGVEGLNLPHWRAFDLCCHQISICDVMIAVIDPTAYGTMVEIGMAHALNKKVYVIEHDEQHFPDLWFSKMCQVRGKAYEKTLYESVDDVLSFLASEIEAENMDGFSPIEKQFYTACRNRIDVVPQFEVNCRGRKYRLDFAVPNVKFGIELDGYEFHSGKDQFTKDRERQQNLELDGWRIVRFSGSQIFKDCERCVSISVEMLNRQKRAM